jgi:hypothetical protein
LRRDFNFTLALDWKAFDLLEEKTGSLLLVENPPLAIVALRIETWREDPERDSERSQRERSRERKREKDKEIEREISSERSHLATQWQNVPPG